MANLARGQVKQVALTVQYPDGSVKTVRMETSDISKLILNPIGNDPLPPDWNHDELASRPTYAVVRNDGTVYGSCSSGSHPPGS